MQDLYHQHYFVIVSLHSSSRNCSVGWVLQDLGAGAHRTLLQEGFYKALNQRAQYPLNKEYTLHYRGLHSC